MLRDRATGELYLRAQYNLSAKMAQRMRVKVNDSVIGRVVQSGRPVMLSGSDLLAVQTSLLVKAFLGVPLAVGDKVIGVLTVDNQLSPRAFGKHDVHLLTDAGRSAAIAIENARLFAAAEHERAKLEHDSARDAGRGHCHRRQSARAADQCGGASGAAVGRHWRSASPCPRS